MEMENLYCSVVAENTKACMELETWMEDTVSTAKKILRHHCTTIREMYRETYDSLMASMLENNRHANQTLLENNRLVIEALLEKRRRENGWGGFEEMDLMRRGEEQMEKDEEKEAEKEGGTVEEEDGRAMPHAG